MNIEISNCYFT